MTEPNDPNKLIGDDGELNYDAHGSDDEDGRKRKNKARQSVRLPLIIVAPLLVVLLGLSLLLLANRFGITLVPPLPTEGPYIKPTYDPRYYAAAPQDESLVIHSSSSDGTRTVEHDYTVTPATYNMLMCGPELARPVAAGKILFSAGEYDNLELFAVDGDGRNLCRVTQNFIQEQMPRWSPDRSRISFVSRRNDGNGSDIYLASVMLTGVFNLTGRAIQDSIQPAWSPDGKQMAFSSPSDTALNSADIFIVNQDGSGRRNLTQNSAHNQVPAWSPDSKQIAFISDRDLGPNKFAIYVINVDGSGIRQIKTKSGVRNIYSVEWSPDGQKLMYYADDDRGLTLNVWTINLQTNEDRIIGLNGHFPRWSPDGTQFVYVSDKYNLMVSPARRIAPVQVSYDLHVRSIADWR